MEDDFPDQLDDLESGYRKLIEQNYHFPEKNIERHFQEIREAIRSNSSELVSFDLVVRKKKMLIFKKRLTTCIVFSNVKLHHTGLLCVKENFARLSQAC